MNLAQVPIALIFTLALVKHLLKEYALTLFSLILIIINLRDLPTLYFIPFQSFNLIQLSLQLQSILFLTFILAILIDFTCFLLLQNFILHQLNLHYYYSIHHQFHPYYRLILPYFLHQLFIIIIIQ